MGWVWSRESVSSGVLTLSLARKATPPAPLCEVREGPTRSKAPCTLGTTMDGNREIPSLAMTDGTMVRSGNPEGARQG